MWNHSQQQNLSYQFRSSKPMKVSSMNQAGLDGQRSHSRRKVSRWDAGRTAISCSLSMVHSRGIGKTTALRPWSQNVKKYIYIFNFSNSPFFIFISNPFCRNKSPGSEVSNSHLSGVEAEVQGKETTQCVSGWIGVLLCTSYHVVDLLVG